MTRWENIMTRWEKIKAFISSDTYNKAMVWYMFIIGTFILVSTETNFEYGLVIFNYLLGFLLWYILILAGRSRNSLQRLLNYINIYNTLPPESITEKEKELYNIEKRLLIENYTCLFNRHDVIVYCVTNPGTELAKYFERNNEILNIYFFKDKFIVITDSEELYTFKKQFEKEVKI